MHLSPVLRIAVILLVLVIIDVSSQHWYPGPVQTKDDDRFSIRDNDKTKDYVSTWLSNQRNPIGTIQNDMNNEPRNNHFIFLNQDIEAVGTRYQTVTPCNGQTFCEDVPDYPSNLVNKILEKHPHLQNYQIDDALDEIQVKSNVPETVQLCLSVKQVTYPRKAQTTNGEYMFIVNNSNYTQGILTETCINEGTPCQLLNDFAQGYVTSCKQKYVSRQLIAVNGNTPDYRSFRFPSSCCCHVEAPDDTTIRGRLSRN